MLRAAAVVAGALFFGGIGVWLYARHAHAARVHVKVSVAAAGEIVQVLVNCNLVYVYRRNAPTNDDVDLGWLDKGDILTFQVSGRRPAGYYALSFTHDSRGEPVKSVGTLLNRVLMSPAQMVFTRSYTVGGLRLQALPCQGDTPQQLEFASSATAVEGPRGGPNVLMDRAAEIAPGVESALAILGFLTLVLAPVADRMPGAQHRRRTAAEVFLAAVGVALGVLWTTAKELDLVAPLCIAVGVGAFVFIMYRLLVYEIDRLCAWWLRRRSGPQADG
jgi:hypothetical protein